MGLIASAGRVFRSPALAYVLVVAAFIYSNVGINLESDHRIHSILVEGAQRDVDRCHDAQTGRSVLRELVLLATADGQQVVFTDIDGFDKLDADTQAYFIALSAVLNDNSGDNSEFRQAALDKIVVPNCAAEEARLDAVR